MQNEKVPSWAFARANELAVKYGMEDEKGRVFDGPYTRPLQVAFARYIAEHEEPPVDPLLEEAINLVINDETERSDRQNDAIRKSGMASKQVRAALNGLRRGIELAREEFGHAG